MTEGTGELSQKAGQILDNFLGRCKQSAAQGMHACSTASVVEDHTTRVTPIEPEYLFADRQQAVAVSKYLKSMIRQQGFKSTDIQVNEAPNNADEYHISIRAAW